MKYLICSFLALLMTVALPAQKVLKPVREQLKAKNAAEAIRLVEQLEKDSVAARLPRLYDLGKEAQIMVNDVQNEKIYLKQAYDTVTFFNSTLQIYDYILKCDKEEQRQLAEEGKKMKYQKDNSETLHSYYANINAGGRYFYTRERYAEAMPYFRYYIDIPRMPIWNIVKACKPAAVPAIINTNAYFYTRSAYNSKQYDEVERYKEIILNDTSALSHSSLEYLALAAQAKGDTAAFCKYLKKGVCDYPTDAFFFSHLVDFYAAQGDYISILHLADERLKADCSSLLAFEAKSLALINLKRYEEVIDAAKSSLEIDSTHAEAYYYVGAAYCCLAKDVHFPADAKSKDYRAALIKQKQLYAEARPYLEKYRILAPDMKQRWALYLYRIYFTLNLGRQFAEIQKIVEKMGN